jgi:uncharacterized protein (DUF111 family)
MRIAFLDTFSGISGDMTVGALLDAGLPLDAVANAIACLNLEGVTLSSERVERSGIAATKFHVRIDGEHPDDPSAHHHHRHAHTHRPYREIRELLTASALEAPVRERALAIFAALAAAEGRVHGVATDDVTFHEVGALDAIVDVVGAAVGFTHFGIEAVFHAPLPLGSGFVDTAHGRLPVPGPAVTELVRGRRVRPGDGASELVTPTGAAIVAALARTEAVPELDLETVGYGAGDRVLADRPNLLRIAIGVGRDGAGPRRRRRARGDDRRRVAAALRARDRAAARGGREGRLPRARGHEEEPAGRHGARPRGAGRSRSARGDRVRGDVDDRAPVDDVAPPRPAPRSSDGRDAVGPVRVKIARGPDGSRNVAPEYEDCRARRARADGGVEALCCRLRARRGDALINGRTAAADRQDERADRRRVEHRRHLVEASRSAASSRSSSRSFGVARTCRTDHGVQDEPDPRRQRELQRPARSGRLSLPDQDMVPSAKKPHTMPSGVSGASEDERARSQPARVGAGSNAPCAVGVTIVGEADDSRT